jgi:iron(III) transport system permease protein
VAIDAVATRSRGFAVDGVALVATLATLACAAPAIAVISFALSPDRQGVAFGGDLLRDGAFGTLTLMLLGGGGATVLGAGAAWLVSLCKFPGRGLFEWALVLPLAAPSYVLAYSYASFSWAGGVSPIEVRGIWGAAFVYAVGLYPYVYLAARAAFTSQSACALEAARTLGTSPISLFWRVALPLARPGIAAGASLAMMEIAADYGAAQHFGLTTLSTAIFRAWYAHQSLHAALQISAVLLIAALVFLMLERRARGRAAFGGGSTRWRPLPSYKLSTPMGMLAASFCALLVVFGAVLPLAWLARLAAIHANIGDIAPALVNSIVLSAAGALITLGTSFAVRGSDGLRGARRGAGHGRTCDLRRRTRSGLDRRLGHRARADRVVLGLCGALCVGGCATDRRRPVTAFQGTRCVGAHVGRWAMAASDRS